MSGIRAFRKRQERTPRSGGGGDPLGKDPLHGSDLMDPLIGSQGPQGSQDTEPDPIEDLLSGSWMKSGKGGADESRIEQEAESGDGSEVQPDKLAGDDPAALGKVSEEEASEDSEEIVRTPKLGPVPGVEEPAVQYPDIPPEKLDGTYLHRRLGRDKKYSHAHDELRGLDPVSDVLKATEKQRKMAVRTTETLDDHHVKLEKYYAFVTGGAVAASTDPEKARHEPLARLRARDLDGWRKHAAEWGQESHDLSMELNGFEAEVTGRRKALTTLGPRGLVSELAKSKEYGAKVLVGFMHREKAAEYRLKGKDSKQFVVDNIGQQGMGAWLWTHAKGSGGGKVLETLTGGLISGEVSSDDGWRDSTSGVKFMVFREDMKKWREKAELLKATGAIGKHEGTYLFLSQLAEVWLPQLRRLSSAVAIWATLLTMLTMGAAAPVAAGAATVSLLITAVMGLIQLVLFIWSLVRERQTNDRNARGHRLMQSEAVTHGKGVIESGVSVGTTGLLASDTTGKMLTPGKAAKTRFTDFKGKAEIDYGGVGFASKWESMGLSGASLDDAGTGSRLLTKGLTAGSEELANKTGSSAVRSKRMVEKQPELGVSFDSSVPAKDEAELGGRRKDYQKGAGHLRDKFTRMAEQSTGVAEKADAKTKKKTDGPSHSELAASLVEMAGDIHAGLDDDVVGD